MGKAVMCPVCYGSGKIDEKYPGAGKSEESMCHGCGGKGWVEVADDQMPYIYPYYPHPAPWYYGNS